MNAPRHLGLRHVALRVVDLERSLHFWRDLLGYRIVWQPDPDNAYLTSGADNLALHRVDAVDAPSAGARLDHVGVFVASPEDVARWVERLAAAGVTIRQGVRTHRDGSVSAYVENADGVVVQVVWVPEAMVEVAGQR